MKFSFEGSHDELIALCLSFVGVREKELSNLSPSPPDLSTYSEPPLVPGDAPEYLQDGFARAGEALPPPPPSPSSREEMLSKLPKINDEKRASAWAMFKDTVKQWIEGFEDEDAEQPNRLQLMQDIGMGAWPVPILVMAYEIGSLQRLVEKALLEQGLGFDHQRGSIGEWLDYCDRVAGTMVQISHMGFPDLAGTYDHSTRWRRETSTATTPTRS